MRVVVGYEAARPDEYGHARRVPIYEDRGPGRAQGGGLSLLDATEVNPRGLVDEAAELTGAAAPIERRRLSPEEYAERTRPKPGHAWRKAAIPTRTPPVARKEPVPMLEPLAAPSIVAGVVTLPVELPCGTCSHAPVCRIRLALTEVVPELLIPRLPPELAGAIQTQLVCAFWDLATDPMDVLPVAPVDGPSATEGVTPLLAVIAGAPVAVPAAPAPSQPRPPSVGRAPGVKGGRAVLPRDRDEREALVMATIRELRASGDVARRLGVTVERIRQIIGEMRRGERLPDDVAAILRDRSRHAAAPA